METERTPQDKYSKPEEKLPASQPQGRAQARPEAILWNTPQLAAYLGVKESTIRYWVYVKYIPHIKFQSLVRFRKTEIDAWLVQLSSAGSIKSTRKYTEEMVGDIVQSIERPPRRGRQPRALHDAT